MALTKLKSSNISADAVTANQLAPGAVTVLYHNDAEKLATTSTGVTITGDTSATNSTLTGYLRGPASFVIDPAAHGDDTGTVVIAGNLQVDGLTTTINSTTLTVDDLNIVLASGAPNAAAANGAGITVDGASATLLYAASGDKFVFNKGLDVTGNIGVSGTVDGVDIAARDAVLTSTTTTAGAALPLAGGTLTGMLGIGATSPSWNLEVDGRALIADTTARLPFSVSRAGGGAVTNGATIVSGAVAYFNGNIAGSDALRIGSMDNGTGAYYIDVSNYNATAAYDLVLQPYLGNVGIGTTTPGEKLEVNGVLQIKRAGDHPAIRFVEDTTTRAYIGSGDWAINGLEADDFGISSVGALALGHSGGVERMRIHTNGNVGIGTASPTAKLVVEKGSHGNYLYVGGSSEQNRGIMFSSDVGSSGPAFLGAKHTIHVQSGGGEILFKNDTYDWLYLAPDGNVGIGTNNPVAKLHVMGDGGYGWGNGAHTKLNTTSRYDMGGYNSGASNVSRQLFYYGYDHANWNTQYIKIIVRRAYYYNAGEAAFILSCQTSQAHMLWNTNSYIAATPFTFSDNTISGNHRVTSVSFNPGATYNSYYFTFEWTDGIMPISQTSTPQQNYISFSH